jgi:hypothetical protein
MWENFPTLTFQSEKRHRANVGKFPDGIDEVFAGARSIRDR